MGGEALFFTITLIFPGKAMMNKLRRSPCGIHCMTLVTSFLSDPPAGGRCRVAMSGKQEVAAATAQAEKAFGAWSSMTAKSRAAVMFRFHALLEKHAEELVS